MAYPELLNISAIVYCSGRIIIPALPAATSVPGLRHAYSPVSMEYLDGVLVAAVACALINRIPSDARRLTFGVCTFFAP